LVRYHAAASHTRNGVREVLHARLLAMYHKFDTLLMNALELFQKRAG